MKTQAQSGAPSAGSICSAQFVVFRVQYPEYFSGWNQWGPCWTSGMQGAYLVNAEDLARTLIKLAETKGRLGGGENLCARLAPNDPN